MPSYRLGKNTFRKKLRAKRRKKAKNRQQLLSVNTVKKIAQQVVDKAPETKFYNFNVKSKVYNLAAPSKLASSNTPCAYNAAGAITSQGTGAPFLTQLFTNASIPLGVQESQRIGDQINIKGFRLKMRLTTPLNGTSTRRGCTYYKIHYMILRGRRGEDIRIQIRERLWTDPFKLQVFEKIKATRPALSVAYHGHVNFYPKITHHTSGDQHFTSTLHSKWVDQYIPINKKYNMGDDDPLRQPNPYYLLIFCRQEKERLGSDLLYVGDWERAAPNSTAPGLGFFNVKMRGLQVYMYYTDP